MGKSIPLWAVAVLAVTLAASSAVLTWALTTMKIIHGTAFVEYRGDIEIVDFKFISDTEVSVTISTNISPAPACTIIISGAGISGSKTIQPGWQPPLTVTIPITGTLTEGTITIEIVES